MPWRMPPLDTLSRPVMSTGRKIGMGALRTYLLVAMAVLKAWWPPSAAMWWDAAGEGMGIQASSGSRASKWVQDERRADVLR